MTTEQIVKCMDFCLKGLCEYCDYRSEQEMCRDALMVDAYNLIVKQQAKIKSLKDEISDLKYSMFKMEEYCE